MPCPIFDYIICQTFSINHITHIYTVQMENVSGDSHTWIRLRTARVVWRELNMKNKKKIKNKRENKILFLQHYIFHVFQQEHLKYPTLFYELRFFPHETARVIPKKNRRLKSIDKNIKVKFLVTT